MTETLKRIVELVEKLPPEQQDRIAEAIQVELDEQAWDALFATPESQRISLELGLSALEEDAAGRTHDATNGW